MITNKRSFWLFNIKFSLSAPQEMYREQYGEYATDVRVQRVKRNRIKAVSSYFRHRILNCSE